MRHSVGERLPEVFVDIRLWAIMAPLHSGRPMNEPISNSAASSAIRGQAPPNAYIRQVSNLEYEALMKGGGLGCE